MSVRVLIFGTSYVDNLIRRRLMDQWVDLHSKINADCEILIVDSNSPQFWDGPVGLLHDRCKRVMVETFTDNVGHLSNGGRDGWGRAFCRGLQAAVNFGADYVVHIEGDSLCRLDVMKICEQMRDGGGLVWSVPVIGTKHVERGWVETGLMFMDVEYVGERGLIKAYDWQDGISKKYPHTPEAVLHELIGDDLEMQNWRNLRDDQKQLTVDNVKDYDWISHATPEIYDAFVAHNMVAA